MFTGIVKGVAIVTALEKRGDLLKYALSFPPELTSGIELGASVAVDGVCQTVVAVDSSLVWFEAISETLNRTTLSFLKLGSIVNIERSAKIGDEIGGHLISGHVAGMASISFIDKNIYTFDFETEWMKYLFSKGFIAIDGMSLTLVDVYKKEATFTVHLIPETLKRSTIARKRAGDLVNIEVDSLTQAAVSTVENLLNHIHD